jgi:hypothetical protein
MPLRARPPPPPPPANRKRMPSRHHRSFSVVRLNSAKMTDDQNRAITFGSSSR